MVEIDCCNCGVIFGMSDELYRQRKDDGKSFFCPAGHSQFFTRSRAEIIRELEQKVAELEQEKGKLQSRVDWYVNRLSEMREEVRGLKRSVASYKGHVSRMRRQRKQVSEEV